METTTKVISGMTEADSSAINTAMTGAGNTVLSNFISLLPGILAIAAIGFVIYTAYKLIKKVRKGGK